MKKIMIIDDYPDSCFKIMSALEKTYEFTIISDPLKALERRDIDHYDAFLVDINMPGLKGDKVIEKLRKSIRGPATFCLMTGADFDSSIAKYHSYVVDEFFNKSGSLNEIKSRFDVVLERTCSMHRVLKKGPVQVNLMTATVIINEQKFECTSTEYRLLCSLISESFEKDYVPRDLFMKNIWGDVKVDDRTLSTHLSNLNKRLETYSVKVKTKRLKGLYLFY